MRQHLQPRHTPPARMAKRGEAGALRPAGEMLLGSKRVPSSEGTAIRVDDDVAIEAPPKEIQAMMEAAKEAKKGNYARLSPLNLLKDPVCGEGLNGWAKLGDFSNGFFNFLPILLSAPLAHRASKRCRDLISSNSREPTFIISRVCWRKCWYFNCDRGDRGGLGAG